MPDVLLDQVVFTDYGQFSLEWGEDMWDGDADRFFASQENGWVAAAVADVVHVIMARRYGGSSVRVESWADEPELEPGWEDCVEVSLAIPTGAEARWATWAGEDGGPLDLPEGTSRLRVSARGRDAGRGDPEDGEVVDFYLLQLWPAPTAPDAIVKVGSSDADYWNREFGGRR
jgi:hypothetical protein